jgi:hypothetical protein
MILVSRTPARELHHDALAFVSGQDSPEVSIINGTTLTT